MQVQCPDCETRFEATPESEIVCPACMATFAPPKAPDPKPLALLPEGVGGNTRASARTWEVQTSEGGVLQGLSRYALREAIYLGKLGNATRLRRPDGTWEPLGAVQEFAAVFRLIGVDPLPAPATRKIAGWKGERVEEEAPAPKRSKQEVAAAPRKGAPILLLAGLGGLLLLLLVAGGLWLAFS